MHLLSASLDGNARRRPALWSVLLGSCLFLLQGLYWHTHIRNAFYPGGDDFALLAHSAHVFGAHPAEWFVRGFADYFRPYPDLAMAYSEFLRPADNALEFLASLVVGRSWSDYLLANYLLAASLAAVVFALAYGVLRCSPLVSSLVTAATVASPAYTYHVLYRPSFTFDYLGALWALLCALSLLRRHLLAAWLFTLLAVLSKETAYFTALAACLTVLACSPTQQTLRRWLQALAFLMPLIFMFVLRRLDFRRSNGVYVFNELSPRVLTRNFVLGFTQWPYMLPGEQHIFERSFHNLASLFLSALIWLLLAGHLLRLLRARRAPSSSENGIAIESSATLLIFLLCSCLLPMVLGLGPRFGACTYPLLFLNLGAIAAAVGPALRDGWAAAAVLCVLTLQNTAILATTFSARTLQLQRPRWTTARSLIEHLAADHHAVQFLVGDVSEALASPDTVQRFAGSPGRIVPVSNLDPGSCTAPASVTLVRAAKAYVVEGTQQPDCATYALLAAHDAPGNPNLFERDLPEAVILYRAPGRNGPLDRNGWHTLHIELSPKGNSYVILAPDMSTSTYRVLAASDR